MNVAKRVFSRLKSELIWARLGVYTYLYNKRLPIVSVDRQEIIRGAKC